jgi:hypothetical protein
MNSRSLDERAGSKGLNLRAAELDAQAASLYRSCAQQTGTHRPAHRHALLGCLDLPDTAAGN